jgi:hypothetical protein
MNNLSANLTVAAISLLQANNYFNEREDLSTLN